MTTLERLRLLLDDPAPTDGSDPAFSDAQLQQLLDEAGGSPERAAADGWTMKAAQAAALVDVTEGNASRAMSDMQANALNMVKLFQKSTPGPTEGRARVGRIRRGR